MLATKHKLVTVGEILVEEVMEPFGLTQAALATVGSRAASPGIASASCRSIA